MEEEAKPAFILPDGYKLIALSADLACESRIYLNDERKDFFLVYTDMGADLTRTFGPFRRELIPMLCHSLEDVFDMRGRYSYIEDPGS
ncbi:MAG: hypothetical protein ACXABY_28930 [Candidatus Thorarchaeota archaeon]|jgi:hypothetical protein